MAHEQQAVRIDLVADPSYTDCLYGLLRCSMRLQVRQSHHNRCGMLCLIFDIRSCVASRELSILSKLVSSYSPMWYSLDVLMRYKLHQEAGLQRSFMISLAVYIPARGRSLACLEAYRTCSATLIDWPQMWQRGSSQPHSSSVSYPAQSDIFSTSSIDFVCHLSCFRGAIWEMTVTDYIKVIRAYRKILNATKYLLNRNSRWHDLTGIAKAGVHLKPLSRKGEGTKPIMF